AYTDSLSGAAKAAILLIALGTNLSSSVLQQLSPDEVERIAAEIVRQKRVRPDLREKVLEECRRALTDQTALGGQEYAREVLSGVFGESKAKELLSRVSAGVSTVGAGRNLKTIPPRQLAALLQIERPQIIALVLAHLPADHAAQVLVALPEDVQGQVALRLTAMRPTDPDVVNTVAKVIADKAAESEGMGLTEVGGEDSVVRILSNVGRSTEKRILDYLRKVDETIAEQIRNKMFVFEDILNLDDRSIQIILREVPQEDLRLALKGVPDNIKEVFFRNMSQRAAETLKEDLEATGPVKLKDVEAAQNRIVAVARQLDEAGEISLRKSSEDLVV
ncbi:MAG: flagellar motor switch protein FliG, partial [Armatimonadota bacterium]|nr:flagellar motor switch protein FliG [Armatimonadota bacterium]